MIIDIDKEVDIKPQLDHTFNIHKEYINHIDLEIDNENEKVGSFYYPFFIDLNHLIENISTLFPSIKWEHFKELELGGNIEFLSFGKLITQNGVILIMISSENGKVYSPLSFSIKLTDFPFSEVKKLCKEYDWFLFHLNSYQYLDTLDDNETERDIIS